MFYAIEYRTTPDVKEENKLGHVWQFTDKAERDAWVARGPETGPGQRKTLTPSSALVKRVLAGKQNYWPRVV